MATFIAIPIDPSVSDALANKVQGDFGNRAYALPSGEWLVSYEGTSRQLFESLGIDDNIVILNFYGYWGSASKDLWEWLSVYQK
jgi:hypothetical protein